MLLHGRSGVGNEMQRLTFLLFCLHVHKYVQVVQIPRRSSHVFGRCSEVRDVMQIYLGIHLFRLSGRAVCLLEI